jgi:hypothetical protein
MAINVTKVEPGDLITASFFNSIVDALFTLQSEIDSIGSTGPGPGPGPPGPVITSVDPSPDVHANAVMTIHGQNFLVPAEQNTVRLDGRLLGDFAAGSDDRTIKVMVPGDIATTAKTVVLSVTANGSAETTVHVVPPSVQFGGTIVVKDTSGAPGTPKVGDTIHFRFDLDGSALATTDQFHVHAAFANANPAATDWQAATTTTGTDAEGIVAVDPTKPPPTVGVDVKVPAGAKSVDMTVAATSLNNDPLSSGLSKTVPIVVGQAQPQGDAHVTIDFGADTNSILHKQTYSGGSVSGAGLAVKFGNTALVTMKVGADQADRAGTYTIAAAVENPDASLWKATLLSPSVSVAAGQTTDVFFQLQLVPPSVAAAGSELRYLTLTATRQETSGVGQVSNYLRFPIGGF